MKHPVCSCKSRIRNLFQRKRKEQDVDLSDVIQVLMIHLETGCTLEQALLNALPKSYRLSNMSMMESVNRAAKKWNDKNFFRFVRLINQYHKNGSQSTMKALEIFYGELCINKMAEIRKKAEEASIKLTLLLMLSLFSIIIVVMTPVVILLKTNL